MECTLSTIHPRLIHIITTTYTTLTTNHLSLIIVVSVANYILNQIKKRGAKLHSLAPP